MVEKRRATLQARQAQGANRAERDIQEQFNDAVAAGDRRLAERIARIWLLRCRRPRRCRGSRLRRYRCRSRSILISAAVELRHFLAGFGVALATL